MRLTLPRRFATPMIAAAAAAGLMLGVTHGVAAADTPPPATSGDKTADNLRWNTALTAVNGVAVDPTQPGVNVVHPGDTVTYTSKFWKSAGIGRYITGMRQVHPAGLEFLSYTASKASTVSPGAGGTTAYCTGGGCNSVPILGTKGYLDNLTFEGTYKIPTNYAFGDYDSGFVFDVYAFSSQSGQLAAGAWIRVVDPAVTTTTGLQAPASAKTGESVTLTANVGPANSVGTVQFKDGGVNIGGPVTVSGGAATLAHTFDTTGGHSITAEFTGGAGFHNSVSAASIVDVTADTATTISAPTAAVVGDNVQISATVTPATATGQVQFKDGGVNVGEPVDVVNGTATISRTFVEASSHTLTAEFTGTGGYTNSASAATELTISDADFGTTTAVVGPTSAVVDTPTNLTATVFPIPSGGQVEFLVNGESVGTAPVGTADGVAVLPYTFGAVGSADVVAQFSGHANFTASNSAGYAVTVNAQDTRTATSTALAVSGDPVVGQAVTLTATVDPANADGTVQFKAGNTPIGGPVAVVNGVATLTHTFDAEGTYAVTAAFTGGPDFKDSVSGPTVLGVAAGTPVTPGGGSLESLFAS